MAKRTPRNPPPEQPITPATSPAGDPLEVVESPQALFAAEAVLASFWTPDRLERAEPIELPTPPAPAGLEFFEAAPRGFAAGEAVVSPPKPADGNLLAEAVGQNFTTSRVANLHTYPYSVVGKLFMTFGGTPMVGSAWVIGESAIITAGHCIFDPDTGRWAENVLFMPRYDNGATIGQWAMRSSSVLKGWQLQKQFAHDMAAVVVTRPIRPSTGATGWMANVDPSDRYLQVGYPAQPPFDGKLMWQTDGRRLTTGEIIMIGGDMTPGCSGGPMFVKRDGTYLANGLNSHRPSGSPGVLCTPYFADNFLKLMEWIRTSGGDES